MAATTARRAGLNAALDGLSARDRLMLALVLIEGLSTAEAAGVMGEPPRRVARDYRSLLSTLRRRAVSPAPAVRGRNAASRTRKAA